MIALIRQDGKPMREGPQEDSDSVARAKAAREDEQVTALAQILAAIDGRLNLAGEDDHIRQHFAQWALIAVRGSALGAEQFRYQSLAMHAATQAAVDCDASLEHYGAVDLLAPHCAAERLHWSTVITRGILAYQGVLGGRNTDAADMLWSHRLEASHDPRRI